LIAVVGMSASAQAQQCSDEDEAAYEIFLAVAEFGFFIDEEFDTDPDDKDCQKVCKTTGKLCKTAAKDITKAEKNITKALAKAGKTLCASSASDKACKDDVKSGIKQAKDALKQALKMLQDSCTDAALEAECENVCNNDVEPKDCDEVFGGAPL
jgi:hypothetical protein